MNNLEFKNIPHINLMEIAELAFGHKEWITSDIIVRYNPYVWEDYEDAREYFELKFEGYFAGENKAKYKVEIYPNRNVYIWYTYKEEINKLLHLSNQQKIQLTFDIIKFNDNHEK